MSTYFSRSVVCDVVRSINSTLHQYPFVVGVSVLVSVSPRDEAAVAASSTPTSNRSLFCFLVCVSPFFSCRLGDDRFRVFALSIEGQTCILYIKIAAS